jgi:hypothetical protein
MKAGYSAEGGQSPTSTLSRRLPKEFAASIRQYAMHTGLAVWAWNLLHANLFLIFWHLIRGGRPGMSRATAHRIWHVIQSDSTQRDMLLRVAQTDSNIKTELLARIAWLIKTTNELSAYRNIVAHTPAIFSQYTVRVPLADPSSTRDNARSRFNLIKHDQFWRFLTGAAPLRSAHASATARRAPTVRAAS